MKKLYLAGAVLCLILAVFCAVKSLPARPTRHTETVKRAELAASENAVPILEHLEEPSPEPVPEQTAPPYVSPIDFEQLKEVNADIYAWLYIPGTDINHPLLQNPHENDSYYLTHNVYHEKDDNGVLFTEYHYNSQDFSDPLTVIYGHRMITGQMFGSLQEYYSDPESIEGRREIIVYTPDRELHYLVFAASPFSAVHIPYQYQGLETADAIACFLRDLKNYHALSAYWDPAVDVTEGDTLLILSTCLAQDQEQRFLVLAKMVYSTV